MHLTLHQHFVLDHTHLAITRLQRIKFKRSRNIERMREKWEKIRSVSLAPGSVPRVVFFSRCVGSGAAVRGHPAVPGLLLPSRGSACAGRSLRRLGLGSRAPVLTDSPRNLHGAEEPSRAAGECHQNRAWGAPLALECSTHHTHPPLQSRVMGAGARGTFLWGF